MSEPQKGRLVLASGNIFRWEVTRAAASWNRQVLTITARGRRDGKVDRIDRTAVVHV